MGVLDGELTMDPSNHAEPEPDPDSDSNPNASPRLGHELQHHPVRFAVMFEAALGVLALALAWLFGLRPWLDIAVTGSDLLITLLATAAVTVAMLMLLRADWRWVRELDHLVRQFLGKLLLDAGAGGLFLVALMAGVCEELLFRGVIQNGLAGLFGPTFGAILALLAASVLFGLAHAVSIAYFVLTFLIGIYLGALYQITGNLLVPILVHFLYDWIMLHWLITKMRAGR